MKFKRILAVVLSALILTSMASFTVSAKGNAELAANPILELLVSSDDSLTARRLKQCERGSVTTQYDAENDIVYNHYVPNFVTDDGYSNSIYFNMYGMSPAVKPSSRTLYIVTYMRSNVAAETKAGFYQVKNSSGESVENPTSAVVQYDGSETWQKMVYTLNLADDFYSSDHLWVKPIGANKVMNDDGTPAMSEDTYFDICGVAVFEDLASAEDYDFVARSKAHIITISFDANGGTADYDSYSVYPGYVSHSKVVFPENPIAPTGMEFIGWSEYKNGITLSGDVTTPDLSTTYYAVYKYIDDNLIETDDIVIPNTFFNKKIDGAGALELTAGVKYPWIDGTTMIDTLKLTRNGTNTGNFATDGYGLNTYNVNLDHYNYVTYYMYVDAPNFKTEGRKIFCNVYQLSGGQTSIESTYTITPNAWQRIPISLANAQAKAGENEVLKQFHFRPLGNVATVENFDGVTIYLEKAVFSVEDPGHWADLNAKITSIKVNGEGIDGYNVNKYEYVVELPFGTTEVPEVTCDVNVADAVVTVTPATDLTDAEYALGDVNADDSVDLFDAIAILQYEAGIIEEF